MARGVIGFVAAGAGLIGYALARETLGFPVFHLVFLGSVLFWAAQATSWNILSGFSGYFSFGQAAFVGVGAYASAVLVGRQGWEYLATLPVAGALGGLLAIGLGALAFRLRSLRGEIFALLTLAVPFILASFIRTNPAIDGGQGVVVPVPDAPEVLGGFQELLFALNVLVGLGALFVAWWMQHSRAGWALFAIHDAEDVAEGLGVPTFRYKMLAIALTGIIGGLGGSLLALQIGFVTVESVFGLTIPLFVIVMSILGGRTHWLGPLVGAGVVVTLQDRLAATGFEGWSLVILGSILAILVVIAPDGLLVRLRRRTLPVAVAFGVPVLALALLDWAGGLVDWLAVGMIAAVVVAFAPGRTALGRLVGRGTGKTDEQPTQRPVVTAGPALLPAQPAAEARADDPPVLACEAVSKSYGGVRALDGVSLTVAAGELVGLVGPNGSGKSTLVGLISGSVRPTSGSIRIAGRPTAGLAPHEVVHLGVARTYQIPRPFASMTLRDNVAIALMFGRTGQPLRRAREEADSFLELVGLAGRGDARPSGINLHERQLLELARALATRPRLLLLDEALAGLNPAEVDHAVEAVRRIHQSGITIVIVEHLLRVVQQLSTRMVVLEQGRLLASGDPGTVMADPEVVRAYLGAHAHA